MDNPLESCMDQRWVPSCVTAYCAPLSAKPMKTTTEPLPMRSVVSRIQIYCCEAAKGQPRGRGMDVCGITDLLGEVLVTSWPALWPGLLNHRDRDRSPRPGVRHVTRTCQVTLHLYCSRRLYTLALYVYTHVHLPSCITPTAAFSVPGFLRLAPICYTA